MFAIGIVEMWRHHQLTVVHYDADFETAATILTFQHRWVLPRGSV
jgi:hypothetical protein